MDALGKAASGPCRVYLSGGATAVVKGWRPATVDVDIEPVPQSDALLRAIPNIKEALHVNVELASPAHLLPELPGWRERSRFIDRVGEIDFFHYDFYAQALSKIARGLEKDLRDVSAMLARSLVSPRKAWALFRQIEPELYRYPRLDSAAFRDAVEASLGPEP